MKKLLFLLLALLLIISCNINTPQPSDQQSIQPIIPPTVPPKEQIQNNFLNTDKDIAINALKLKYRKNVPSPINEYEKSNITILEGARLNGKPVSGEYEYFQGGNPNLMEGSYFCSIKIGEDSYVTPAPITVKGDKTEIKEVMGSLIITKNNQTTTYKGIEAFNKTRELDRLIGDVDKTVQNTTGKRIYKLGEYSATDIANEKIITSNEEIKLGKDIVKLGLIHDFATTNEQFNYFSVNGTFYSENCYNEAKAQVFPQE